MSRTASEVLAQLIGNSNIGLRTLICAASLSDYFLNTFVKLDIVNQLYFFFLLGAPSQVEPLLISFF